MRNKLIVLTAVLASLLEIIDTSIVNVAIPSMMGNLGATLDEISWVVTGYIIANAIVLPISSWLSAQVGRKLFYTSCIVIFTASSVACGFSTSLEMLVIFRIIQGLAGGALLPTSQALIFESFPKEKAGMASAIYGMSVMVGPTVGPVLGGYLTDHFGWRMIFNINLPIGIVVAILSFLLVEDVGYDPLHQFTKEELKAKRKSQRTPIDVWGLVFLISGIGCLQFVLERGQADDWFDSNLILISTIVAIVSLVALIWWELKKAPHPILVLRHFKNKSFTGGVLLMSGVGVVLYGLIFIIPVFVSTIQGLTATQTGALFIPGAFFAAMLMPFIGASLRKVDPRALIATGIIALSMAAYQISFFDTMTSVDGMFFPLLLRGAALAFLFVPINTVVLSQFHGPEIGQAAGLLNLCRQLGGSVGIALISTFFQRYQVTSYSVLANHVTMLDHEAWRIVGQISGSMKMKLSDLVGMGSQTMDAVKILSGLAHRQAFVIGYQKIVRIIAFGYLLSLLPLMMLKKKEGASAPVMDAH
jgi:DHA2 family multidrug resistance protein